MNLLLVAGDEIDDAGRVQLEGRRAAHVRRVLRAQVGDTLRVGVLGGDGAHLGQPTESWCPGARGTAHVDRIDDHGVTLSLGEVATVDAPPAVSLALALPRPKALSRVLASAASLGVREIALLNGWRVDKSYWSSPRLAEDAVDRALRLGLEQGQRTWLPALRRERLLMPYLRQLEQRWTDAEREARPLALIAHPGGAPVEQAFAACAEAPTTARETLLAIGPEGGWLPDEVAAFERAGFHAVSLLDATLTTHDAVVAALAQLALLRRRHAEQDGG